MFNIWPFNIGRKRRERRAKIDAEYCAKIDAMNERYDKQRREREEARERLQAKVYAARSSSTYPRITRADNVDQHVRDCDILLNPLVSPISPISIWNNNDYEDAEKHSKDSHRHSNSDDTDRPSHSNSGWSHSHDSSSDSHHSSGHSSSGSHDMGSSHSDHSSSYDSSSYDSGSSYSGGD